MTEEAKPKLGRRRILAGAAGGVAALATRGLAAPEIAAGAPVVLYGNTHNATTDDTTISRGNGETNVTIGGPAFGLAAISHVNDGMAIQGYTSAINGVGTRGRTSGHHSQVAVDAVANTGLGEGIAVRARTVNGIGVYTEATGGYALQVVGRAVFNRSGKTSIAAGAKSKVVSGFALDGGSIVVATVQGNPAGVWVRNVSVDDAANTFTIRLNKAAPVGGVTVGFFIVN